MKRKQISMLVSVALVVGLATLSAPKLAMAASCTWTGAVSTGWVTTGNWSGCNGASGNEPPVSGDTVTIAGGGNQPTIGSNDVTIASLILNSGATLTIASGRTLTVNGDISLNANGGSTTAIDNAGTLVATAGIFTTNRSDDSDTAQLVIGNSGAWTLQNITTNSNTKLTVTSNPTIHVKGNISRAGSFDPGTSTIIFDSGGSQSLSGDSQHYFYNLEIASGTTVNHTSGGGGLYIRNSFTNNGTLAQDSGSVGRRLQFDYGATYPTSSMAGTGVTNIARIVIDANKTVNAGSHSIIIDSNNNRVPWDNDGTFNGGTATVTFNGDSTTDIAGTGTNNFNNLVIANRLSAGSVNLNVAGNWTNDGTFTAGTGTVTFNGTGISSYGGSSTTTFNNLTINSGATLDVGTNTIFNVSGTMTNDGTLKQTKTVNQSATTSFLNVSSTKYYGVDITLGAVGDMGSTVVSIKGNQACNTTDTLVHRCFDIAPTTAQNATIKFWYLNAERNGNTPASMKVYRWTDSAWSEETGAYTRGTSGSYEWVQVIDVDEYSVFGLDDGSPTAVTLSSFAAGAVNDFRAALLWPLAALASTATLALAGLLWARRR